MTVKRLHSLLITLYMLLAFSYYFVNNAFRAIILFLIVGISLLPIVIDIIKNKKRIIINKKIIFFAALFYLVSLIQLMNGTLTPFVIYILSAPCFMLLILKNKIESKFIKIPIYIISIVFMVYYIRHKTFDGMFQGLSVNYVSVVLIMNAVLINTIERINNERISVFPSLMAFFFSLLSMGRAGIICSFILVLNVIYFYWKEISFQKKIISAIIFFMPIIAFTIINYELISNLFIAMELLDRFGSRGVESPSRMILINEYLENMTFKNLFFGYNFEHNYWFKHYGLNPHNSLIRLHHYFGFLFFLVIFYILKNGIKLFNQDKFLGIMLLAIILRSLTDSIMFQTIYDFILLLLIFIPIYKNKINSIKNWKV